MAGAQVTVALNQLEKQRFGYQAISLTNFELDTEPEIAGGSKVEIGGALYEFAAGESITGWGGIGNSNDVYIKLTVTGTAVAAAWTTTAPMWSESKQGWYASLVRYIGGCYKDANGDYTQKFLFEGRQLAHTAEEVDYYGEIGFVKPSVVKVRLGWLWCDGSTIDKTANPEYTALVDMLKREAGADAAHPYYAVAANEAVLPDIRGSGIRGVDAAANRDKDGVRKSGDFQDDQMENHTHTTDIGTHGHGFDFSKNAGAGEGYLVVSGDVVNTNASADLSVQDATIGNKTSGNPSSGGGAAETIMKNVALYYLIKY